jgi:hypothetical protein
MATRHEREPKRYSLYVTYPNTPPTQTHHLPKRTNFQTLTQEELNNIVNEINNTSLATLRYHTPAEMFEKHLKCCALTLGSGDISRWLRYFVRLQFLEDSRFWVGLCSGLWDGVGGAALALCAAPQFGWDISYLTLKVLALEVAAKS